MAAENDFRFSFICCNESGIMLIVEDEIRKPAVKWKQVQYEYLQEAKI